MRNLCDNTCCLSKKNFPCCIVHITFSQSYFSITFSRFFIIGKATDETSDGIENRCIRYREIWVYVCSPQHFHTFLGNTSALICLHDIARIILVPFTVIVLVSYNKSFVPATDVNAITDDEETTWGIMEEMNPEQLDW